MHSRRRYSAEHGLFFRWYIPRPTVCGPLSHSQGEYLWLLISDTHSLSQVDLGTMEGMVAAMERAKIVSLYFHLVVDAICWLLWILQVRDQIAQGLSQTPLMDALSFVDLITYVLYQIRKVLKIHARPRSIWPLLSATEPVDKYGNMYYRINISAI